MIQTSKLLWGEGLFLRPQHFQRQDAYHEGRLADTARALNPYAWGVPRRQGDSDALASQMLRVTELSAVLPDGERVHAPTDDELPPALSLASVPPGISELLVQQRQLGHFPAPQVPG